MRQGNDFAVSLSVIEQSKLSKTYDKKISTIIGL